MNGNIHPEAAQLEKTLRVDTEVMEKEEEDKQDGGEKVVQSPLFEMPYLNSTSCSPWPRSRTDLGWRTRGSTGCTP